MTDGGPGARVHETERCVGAGDDACVREYPGLTRKEDEIHVTKFGPRHSKSGRRVLCAGCHQKQRALTLAKAPDLADTYDSDDLRSLKERFPDILAGVDIPMSGGGGD